MAALRGRIALLEAENADLLAKLKTAVDYEVLTELGTGDLLYLPLPDDVAGSDAPADENEMGIDSRGERGLQ